MVGGGLRGGPVPAGIALAAKAIVAKARPARRYRGGYPVHQREALAAGDRKIDAQRVTRWAAARTRGRVERAKVAGRCAVDDPRNAARGDRLIEQAAKLLHEDVPRQRRPRGAEPPQGDIEIAG